MHDRRDDDGRDLRGQHHPGQAVQAGRDLERVGRGPELQRVVAGLPRGARAAERVRVEPEVGGGEHVQAGQRLARGVPERRQHRAEVGVQAHRALDEAGTALVLAGQGDRAAGQQLAAQPLELHAGALELGRGAGPPQGRLGGHLGRAAAQHAVPQQAVHSRTGGGHGLGHPGQAEEGGQRVGRGGGGHAATLGRDTPGLPLVPRTPQDECGARHSRSVEGAPVTSSPPRTYEQVQATDEFQGLRRSLRRFVFPATALFLAWYLLYVLMSAYARDVLDAKVLGNINVAYVFGLLQFVSTFVIAWVYSRYADRHFDPVADRLRAELEGEGR